MRRYRLSILVVFTLLFALKAVANEPVPEPVSTRFPNIRASLDDGFFVLAEQLSRGVLRSDPKDREEREAVLLLAHALWGQKRYSEMLDLLSSYNGDPEFVYWRARAFFELKEYRKALQQLNRSPEKMETSRYAPATLRLKGHIYQLLGQLDQAEKAYTRFSEQFIDHPRMTENRFDLADVYVEQGRITDALALYEQLSGGADKVAAERAQLKFAHLLYRQGVADDVEAARSILTRLGSSPETRLAYRIDAYVDLAALEELVDQQAAAVLALREAVRLSPDAQQRVPLKMELAKLLMRNGEAKAALQVLEECRAEAPNAVIAAALQLEKARALTLEGQYEQADGAYQVYLDVADDPKGLAEAYLGKGLALWSLERFAEAADIFDKVNQAEATNTQKADALFKAGDSYYRAGKYDEAEKRYVSFISTYPEHENIPEATYQLGLCQATIGRVPEALATFASIEEQFEQHPVAEMAALRAADVLFRTHDYEGALQKYIDIHGVYTNEATAALSLHQQGLVLYDALRRYDEAQVAFEGVISQYPNSEYASPATYLRGFCLANQGKTEEAEKTCRDFIKQYPDSEWTPEVIFWLAERSYNHGHYETAIPLFLQISTDFKDNRLAPRALYWAGRAEAALSNYVKANELFSSIAKNYPDSDVMPQARFAQGDVLTELGRFSQAILAFEEIIKNYPESYLVNSAWGRKGDCQFTLGNENSARYAEAMNSYQAILDRPSAPSALRLHAESKIGKCLEKTNVLDKAFNRYMNVVYTFLNDNVERSPYSVMWFTKSAFDAAKLMELEKKWMEAVTIYERVVEANVPAKDEALKRIERIKKDNWLLFQEAEEKNHVGTDG